MISAGINSYLPKLGPSELANMVKMPFMPKLNFVVDKGTAATVRVNELLKNLNIPTEEEDDD